MHRKNRLVGCEAGVHFRLFGETSTDAINIIVGSGIAEVELKETLSLISFTNHMAFYPPRLDQL